MPVKMIASRLHYVSSDLKEYKKGESFMAKDDREADMLEKRKRAVRAPVEKTTRTRAMKPRQVEPPPDPQPVPPEAPSIGFYSRRDMRAEDE